MMNLIKPTDSVLLIGAGDLVAGIAMCLLNTGHRVHVCTGNIEAFTRLLKKLIVSQKNDTGELTAIGNLSISPELNGRSDFKLVIAITREDEEIKTELLERVERLVTRDAIIAINTESIDLPKLQEVCMHPGRLIGLNWTAPAHTTFFLEIINSANDPGLVDEVFFLAKSFWAKDPYIVNESGIRSRLVSAMAREACFLVDHDYASVDDIDRACRNDAGYYLPFSGNCRYMDLMGTYGYGKVMKDLNPDLSKARVLPKFLDVIVKDGGLGMENKKGFYNYSDEEVAKWKNTMREFSYKIHSIIEKYPFNYNKKEFTE